MTKKTRAAFVLLAATAGTAVAAADPSPNRPTAVVQPRTLATGAPACGNVVGKYMQPPPVCKTARTVVTAVREQLQEIRETVAIFNWVTTPDSSSLTVAEVGRPRS